MKLPKSLKLFFLTATLMSPIYAPAAEFTIKMLNYGDAGGMVFEPDFVHAQPGDTIHFVATHSSHSSRSYLIPEGATAWNSELDKDVSITLNVPGTYLYYCPPHLMMAMIGVIQVGDTIDTATIEKAKSRLRPKLVMKAERLDHLLEQLNRIH